MNAPSLSDRIDCPFCAATLPVAVAAGRSAAAPVQGEHRSFPPGSIIYPEGGRVSGAFHLCSGGVILTRRDADGVEHVVGRERQGAILGYRHPAGEGRYLVTAIADTDVTLCFMPIEAMRGIVAVTPSVTLRLIESFCRRIAALEALSI